MGELTENEIRCVLAFALLALQYIHSHGIIHGVYVLYSCDA